MGVGKSLGVAGALLTALALGACQGSTGSSGLTIPAPQYNNPAGPGAAATSSRQQTLEGAVSLGSDLTEIPLPSVNGFAVALALGSPTPVPAVASPDASASLPAPKGAGALHGTASVATAATAAPTASPGARPSPTASSQPLPATSGSASAAADKIVTKTTIYPDDAPTAPSPKPTGEVQTFAKRTAIVRGYLEPASDIPLYGLGAIRFTIPEAEQASGRGYTVAVFTAGKKHHEGLVAFDASPTLLDNVVASSLTEPLLLKKATGYLILLYGDELAATPAPPGSYPTPGTNPFPTQTPGTSEQPQPGGYPQQPGYPQVTPRP